jgi:DNA-directed RNA polymerase subunit RPC12/RpoP
MIFIPRFLAFWNCLSDAADPTLDLLSIAQVPNQRWDPSKARWAYMLGMREIPYPVEPVRCPDCRHSMVLVCTLPKFVSLPEVRKYRCVECGLNASTARGGVENNAAIAIQPQRAVFKHY